MEKIERTTHQIDATGKILGRLATQVAILLRGKDQPNFRLNLDTGANVEVINASKIKFSGKKLEQKEYIWHTNYPGGLKRKKVKDVFAKDPGQVLRTAVMGMLPKNKLRAQMIKRLKVTA